MTSFFQFLIGSCTHCPKTEITNQTISIVYFLLQQIIELYLKFRLFSFHYSKTNKFRCALKKTSPEMAQLLKSSLANRRLILLDGILIRFLLLIVNIFNYIKSTFGKVSALLPLTLMFT